MDYQNKGGKGLRTRKTKRGILSSLVLAAIVLGLTHLLITPSKAIAGAATLLIRLCTLWFGLWIGVIALVLFRTTQHIDFSTVRGKLSENHRSGINDALPSDASQATLQTTSVLSNTGDKFL